MKHMNWALAMLIWASGSATARVDVQAPFQADGGSASVDYRVGTEAWARHIDFATASGMAPAPNWEPLGDVDFGRPPALAPALVPDSTEPISLPANHAGSALADNIAVENNLVNGLINVQQVPEPSAWLMMLAGVGAIAFVIRRRLSESNG